MIKTIGTMALVAAIQTFGAWQPLFQEYQTVKVGGDEFKDLPVDVWGDGKFRGFPAANFTDFNKDGLNDLVVGLFDRGSIIVAQNSGTQETPFFDTFRFLNNEGQDTIFANPI